MMAGAHITNVRAIEMNRTFLSDGRELNTPKEQGARRRSPAAQTDSEMLPTTDPCWRTSTTLNMRIIRRSRVNRTTGNLQADPMHLSTRMSDAPTTEMAHATTSNPKKRNWPLYGNINVNAYTSGIQKNIAEAITSGYFITSVFVVSQKKNLVVS